VTTPPPVAATSRLRLFPFLVNGGGDRYTVINRVGGHAISTGQAGVEAIRLLGRGKSVEQARRILGRRYGHATRDINLAPLLNTLFQAGFVRSLDGRPITPPGAPAPQGLRFWINLRLLSPLLGLALKHLPPRFALRLAYRWFTEAQRPELERRIAANLRRAPRLAATDRGIARLAAANRAALRKQFCDRLLLGAVPPRRLHRWLSREVRVSGLEHLARARANGAGVILCSLHLGSYGLIPFVLGARGTPVTVYAGFGAAARADVDAWLSEQELGGERYPVSIAAGTIGLRSLVRSLEKGETVVFYCDQAAGESGGPPDNRGWISVPFLGTRIWIARGLGWLRHRTGAAVLPVALFWDEHGGHHLRIEPQLLIADAAVSQPADAPVMAAYQALERLVERAPAQWLKWAEFDGMIAE
jgi:lauroyl/myristoyl acyltransferase